MARRRRAPETAAGRQRPAAPPRFDPHALRALAGEAVFARGEAYHRDGRVELLSGDGRRVLARVLGTEAYRSELRGGGAEIGGACSCPAFADHGFCKHLVAAALAANAAAGAGEVIPDRLGAIRAHLRAQGTERLVEMILGLAERDPALLDRLDLAASAAAGDPATLGARLREALRRALRTGGGGGRFVEYREAGGWVQGVLDLLDQVEALVGAGHARLALELLDELFPRIGRALENVDDSDGGGTGILERAAEIHLAACRAARPEPVALARDLFARETGDDLGTFDGAGDTYAELLGPGGLAEYRRLAQAAWEALPRAGRRGPPGGGRLVAMDEAGVARHALFRILDRFAEREGNLDRRIALRAADLAHAQDHLRLAQLCLAHGREAEALRWAEEGAWLFDDPSGEPLLLFLAERHLAAGRRAEAEAALWRGFERRPSAALYEALARARGGKPGAPGRAGLADRAVALVEARIAAARGAAAAAWARGGLAALLVEILALEGRLPAAWAAARAHGCPDHALLRLAAASEAAMPEEALGAYAAVVERQVGLVNRQGYAEACRLVARMGALRGRRGEGPEAAQRGFVEDLLRRHAAKRSFVAMLREATGAAPPPAPAGEAPARGAGARRRR